MDCIIDGFRLNYVEDGSGPAVLFLHGWGSNAHAFDQVVSLVRDRFRMIRLDFPGFGDSDTLTESWCVDDYTDITIKFIQALGLEEVTLVGHSFGGRVIIKMNSRDLPFRVSRVILVDSAGVIPPKNLKKEARIKVFKAGKKVLQLKPVEKMFPDALENFRGMFGSADYNSVSGPIRDTLVRVVNEDLTHLLKNIKAPTLLIWGDQDDATPLRDAHIMEREIPDAGLFVIKGAGHFSFLKDPYVVAEAMKSFIV